MAKLLFFILFCAAFSAARAESPIRQMCGGAEEASLKDSRSLDDLSNSVCRFTAVSLVSNKTKALADQVRQIISKLKQDNKASHDWQDNLELDHAMRALAESTKIKSESDPGSKNKELSSAMKSLIVKYGTWEQREADKNGYLKALKNTLLMTSSGKHLYSCFSDGSNPKIGRGIIVETTVPDKKPLPGYGGTMSFQLFPSEDKPGVKDKSMIVDYGMDPLVALVSMGHEFQHSCAAAEALKCESKEASSKESKVVCDQMTAIDEVRAYHVETQVFTEMTEASPHLMCSSAAISEAYGHIPMRVFDFTASNEEEIERGDFLKHLIPFYIKEGELSSMDEFTLKTSDGKMKFRPDFIKRVRDSGFNITSD